jgi:tetratricopeptide (TPR) repeat protein
LLLRNTNLHHNMNLPFQYKELLWLFLLLPILVSVYFYALQKKKSVFKKLGDEALVKELTANYSPSSFHKKFILLFISMGLIITSIANLRTAAGAEKINKKGIDVMIAIDISKSMLAKDIQPNRLERAKQVLNKLIDKLDNDRIGIVVFAGKAYLQMPLTADHSAAKMYLAAATPETITTQGTVIGDALKMCSAAFNAKEKKYKAVVLISDGEDHDENALKVAEQMGQEGIQINTIGIGSPQGATIIDEVTKEEKKDNEGNIVITKLNEQTLNDIAVKGKGTYMMYESTERTVSNLYNQLSGLDKRSVTDNGFVNYKSWFQYLLAAAFLFLLIELFISELKKVKKPKLTIAVLLLCFFNFSANAQKENELIKKGNDAYKKSDFENAIKNYGELVQKNETNAIGQYNLGNALYKSDKKDDAISAYDKAFSASKTPTEKSNALYNKAVVLQNNKKLDDCIATYKNALKLNPGNDDARQNLQMALKKQAEQKKEEQKDKKDKKDKKKDDEKDPNKDKKEDQQPKPKPSNMSKKEAEKQLKALSQKEKDLQDKLHKMNVNAPNKLEKDW